LHRRAEHSCSSSGADTVSIESGVLLPDGAFARRGTITTGHLVDVFAMLPVVRDETVWLARDGASRNSVQVLLQQKSTVREIGPGTVPLDKTSARSWSRSLRRASWW
jgi:hypothetical protein